MFVNREDHTKLEQDSALGDLLVLDLTDEKGLYAGKLLADMGGLVIKIEPPGADLARHIGPFYQDTNDPKNSLFYWYHNTSKKSITLDIHTTRGQELLKRLARHADVLLESSPYGYLAALGLDYQTLSQVNPALIFTSLTGFGQTGPYRDYVTSDLVAMAMGGPMASCGYDDIPGTPPIRCDGWAGYLTGCHYAAVSTMAAIFCRDITGHGQHLDVSLHEALSCTTEAAMPWYIYQKQVPFRQTGRHHSVDHTPPAIYWSSDGKLIHVFGTPPQTIDRWVGLLAWMEEYDIGQELHDVEYKALVNTRSRSGELIENLFLRVRELIARMPGDAVYRRAQSIGLPWGIVRSPDETLGDPHLWDRGFFVEVEHPELDDKFVYPGAPYIFSGTPWKITRRAPFPGEDNEEIYINGLGLSSEELELLKEDGVV
ncbi:CoA transferase [Dehalococcoidia bacterium]|nr:CoA transferase [Dehalococcoidia bacterium]